MLATQTAVSFFGPPRPRKFINTWEQMEPCRLFHVGFKNRGLSVQAWQRHHGPLCGHIKGYIEERANRTWKTDASR